jgi:hypothetical protein
VWCPSPSLGDTVAAILQGTGELYFATTENLLGSVAVLVRRVAYCVEQIFLGDYKKSKFLQASKSSLRMQFLLYLSQFVYCVRISVSVLLDAL